MGEHQIEESGEASLVYIVSSRMARTVQQVLFSKDGVGVRVARESVVLKKEGGFVHIESFGKRVSVEKLSYPCLL